jgi:hypothetical protein
MRGRNLAIDKHEYFVRVQMCAHDLMREANRQAVAVAVQMNEPRRRDAAAGADEIAGCG